MTRPWPNMVQPGAPPPQPKPNHDPKNQVLCNHCGCANLIPRRHCFRTPGQVIGSFDVTMDEMNVCEDCGEVVNIFTSNLRKDIKDLDKPA